MARRRPAALRLAIALALAVLLGVLAGVAAHLIFRQSARADGMPLPELHGQATWAAGERPAPAFTFRNVLGGRFSLATAQGRPTLITFLDSKCRSLCPIVGRDIGDVQRSARSRQGWLRANSSATRKGPSPEPSIGSSADLSS